MIEVVDEMHCVVVETCNRLLTLMRPVTRVGLSPSVLEVSLSSWLSQRRMHLIYARVHPGVDQCQLLSDLCPGSYYLVLYRCVECFSCWATDFHPRTAILRLPWLSMLCALQLCPKVSFTTCSVKVLRLHLTCSKILQLEHHLECHSV